MPELDDLMTELRADGELDSVGEFTLDRSRARDKMRHFQLADPRAYVLELVQAAVLAGASEARFEIDADDMRLAFDGRPFTAEDFEKLYSAMFARHQTAGARRQLALGLNAAMALDPRHVYVESGTARMQMTAGADDEISTARQPVAGTRIQVRDRFGNRTVLRFFRKLRGNLAEVVYLRERCPHVRLPIHVNGQLISGQPPLADALGRVAVDVSGFSIVGGFTAERRAASLRILKEGVWIADHQLEELPHPFVCCVEGAELEKDVSQRDIVRNEAYGRLSAALPEVLHTALARLAEVVHERPSRERLFRRVLFHPSTLPLAKAQLAAVRAGNDPPKEKLTAVPLWTSARNPRTVLSLSDLFRHATQGRVSWSRSRFPEVTRQDSPPIAVIKLKRERNYLKELFGESFYFADTSLQNEKKRAANVQRWHLRRMWPKIPAPSGSLIKVSLATDEVKGEVGIFHDPFRHSEGYGRFSIWLITEGRLLEKRTTVPVIPGLAAALEADFQPSKLFDQVNIDPLFVRVVLTVARALGPLMNELASKLLQHAVRTERFVLAQRFASLSRRCVIPYLGLDWQGEGLRQFLASFGITGKRHFAYARRSDEEEPIAAIPTGADLTGDDPPSLARLHLFETLHGSRLSLSDLAARSEERWLYLPRDRNDRPILEENVLLLDEAELAALRRVFTTKELMDYTAAYDSKIAAARHLQKAPVALRPGGLVHTEFEAGGVRGRIGLRYPTSPETPVYAHLQLLKYDRHLDNVEYEVPIGPIVGMINDDELTPNADWSGVVDDERLTHVRRWVLENVAKMLVERSKSTWSDQMRQILLNALTRLFSTEAACEPWAAELAGTLEALPVFTALDGGSVDLRQIREVLSRDGQLDYRLTHRNVEDEAELAEDRFVLRLSDSDHKALAAIFGAEALADAREWLQARRQAREIASAEPLERFELSTFEVLVKTPLGGDLRGEIGLRSEPGEPALELRLCRGGRRYATWGTEAPFALVALVEDDALELDDHGLLDLSGPRPAEVAELCLARIPELIAELIADEELWRGPSRPAARGHLIDYLVAPTIESRDEEERQAVANLPAFDGVNGPYSFVELCRSYAVFDRQAYLTRPQRRVREGELRGQPMDPRRCVLIVAPQEVIRLQRLFPNLENYELEWDKEQSLRWRLKNAPALPAGPPERTLISRNARGRDGLKAQLWLPADPGAELACAFGFAGRQLRLRLISDLFPCAGVVTGEGLVAAAGRVTPHQREGLERSAFQLYRQLAKDLTNPSRGRELHGDRARAARRLLDRVRVALLKSFEKAGRGLDDDYVELLHQLEEMQLSEREEREEDVSDPGVETAEPETAEPETREARLLYALHVELAWARERHADLLDEKNLDRIVLGRLDRDVVARCFNHGVTVNRRQALVRKLLEGGEMDPVLVAFLASAVYSAMNYFWQEIEDDHEREFHRDLVDGLLDRGSA